MAGSPPANWPARCCRTTNSNGKARMSGDGVRVVPGSAGVGRAGDTEWNLPGRNVGVVGLDPLRQAGDILDLDDEFVLAGRQIGWDVEVTVEEAVQATTEQTIDLGRAAQRLTQPADESPLGVADGERAGEGGLVERAILATGEVAQLDIDLDEVAGPVAGAGLEGMVGGKRIIVAKAADRPAESHLGDLQSGAGPQHLGQRLEPPHQGGQLARRDPVQLALAEADDQGQQPFEQLAGGRIKVLEPITGLVRLPVTVAAPC